MKCPLLFKVVFNDLPNVNVINSDCLGEECAWYIADISMCAVRDLALELRYTQHRLADVAKNVTIA